MSAPIVHATDRKKRWLRSSPILTYHTVALEPSRYVYSVTSRQFGEHLKVVAECSRELPQVTFDDGRVSDYDFALPLLEKHGIRATFFVAAGLIAREPGFMNWEQVRAIASAGHSVQSHGWSHLLLTSASRVQLHQELQWSRTALEDHLGVPVKELSLPGGRWNTQVLEVCADIGYERVYHSDPWLAPERHMGMEFLGRLMVRNSMDARRIEALLRGRAAVAFYYRAQHLLKQAGKQVIGDQTYHRLWKRVAKTTGQV